MRISCIYSLLSFDSKSNDALVHHGRHFGRTIHAFCSVYTLLTNGMVRLGDLEERGEEQFSAECAFLS